MGQTDSQPVSGMQSDSLFFALTCSSGPHLVLVDFEQSNFFDIDTRSKRSKREEELKKTAAHQVRLFRRTSGKEGNNQVKGKESVERIQVTVIHNQVCKDQIHLP
jgi:hypothetical protein